MKLLALETSTVACSVALAVDGEVAARHEERPREHTRLLLPMVRSLLGDAGLGVPDLDAVIVGNGPGSFIGLRIAASVAQGLCHASGASLVAVSSLAAVARAALATGAGPRVLVAQDAHRDEVYLEGYVAGDDGEPAVCRPVALVAAGVVPDLGPSAWLAAGAGWTRYPELLEANRGQLSGRSAVDYPRASDLIVPGSAALAAGRAIEPEALEPHYVRERVAAPLPGERDSARGSR